MRNVVDQRDKVQIGGSRQSAEVRNREKWKSNAQRVAAPDVAEGRATPVSIAFGALENTKLSGLKKEVVS